MMETYDFGYTTLEGVVERVNTGAVQGFEDHTSEHLAASYAFDAAQESGFTDGASVEAHLDFLAESGAEFDHAEALRIATN